MVFYEKSDFLRLERAYEWLSLGQTDMGAQNVSIKLMSVFYKHFIVFIWKVPALKVITSQTVSSEAYVKNFLNFVEKLGPMFKIFKFLYF